MICVHTSCPPKTLHYSFPIPLAFQEYFHVTHLPPQGAIKSSVIKGRLYVIFANGSFADSQTDPTQPMSERPILTPVRLSCHLYNDPQALVQVIFVCGSTSLTFFSSCGINSSRNKDTQGKLGG